MQQLIFILTIIFISFHIQAQPSTPSMANTCIACHGQNGISHNQLWPNLAGQKEAYLIKQLKAFKLGERKDPMMGAIAQNLIDAEIETLAQYFSKLTGPSH